MEKERETRQDAWLIISISFLSAVSTRRILSAKDSP
jgi:hypothetical protein